MKPEQFERVRSAFLRIADLDEVRREEYLERTFATDPEARHAVQRLLREDADPASLGSSLVPSHLECSPVELPERIGNYRILGLLGVGGMGVVYEAEQLEPLRRVALKVVHSSPHRDEVSRRLLEREARALALLDHPSIATIFEAGTEEACQYFAMERVVGVPLTDFVRDGRLPIRKRIELFCRVCDAVHYAHQRGVIHRDLKPSNILVTENGLPKVLDFGLARIFTTESDSSSNVTAPGIIMGTLAYMSPEQARAGVSGVDARSDIYSLGVILYELVADRTPYAVADVGIPEAVRIICEQTPPAPGVFQRECRGDISTVILKALSKGPEDRYSSAAALGDDIRRAITHLPISARAPSPWYQLQKLFRRHTLPFSLAALLLLVLTAGSAGLGWLSLKLADERDAAKHAWSEEAESRASAEAFVAVLSDLLNGADPETLDGEEPSLRQVLDSAYAGLADIEHPVARARLMTVMGHTYARLDSRARSRELLKSAVEILRNAPGDNRKELADALMETAFSGPAEDAEGPATEALELRVAMYGEADPRVAEARNLRGEMRHYSGRHEDALEDFRNALSIWESVPNQDMDVVASTLANCGASCTALERLDEAEDYLVCAVAIMKDSKDRGAEILTRENLAKLLFRTDKERAVKAYEQVVALARDLYRPNHPKLGYYIRNCAHVVSHTQGWSKGAPLFEEAAAIHRAAYKGDHGDLGYSLYKLGCCRMEMGDLAGAAESLEEATEMLRRILGPDQELTVRAEKALCQVREHQENRARQ